MTTFSSAQAAVPAAPAGTGAFRLAVLLVALTLVLIKMGAMVTSTDSGLAFYDWPLANGSLWPAQMTTEGYYEHLHRIVGAVVGLVTIALVVVVHRRDPRPWLRKLVYAVLGLVILQGLLGGATVLARLPAAISATHGTLAQVCLCAMVFVAFALAPGFAVRCVAPAGQVRTARRLTALALGMVFAQLVAGAVVRHANLTGVLWLHVLMSMVVALCILLAALHAMARFREVPGMATTGRWVLGVLGAQLVLGFATLAARGAGKGSDSASTENVGRALILSGHVLFGALTFLLATLLLARVYRNLVPAPAGGAPATR